MSGSAGKAPKLSESEHAKLDTALLAQAYVRNVKDNPSYSAGVPPDGLDAAPSAGESLQPRVEVAGYQGLRTESLHRFLKGVLASTERPPTAIATLGGGKWVGDKSAAWHALSLDLVQRKSWQQLYVRGFGPRAAALTCHRAAIALTLPCLPLVPTRAPG
jgi:hypothetical protein